MVETAQEEERKGDDNYLSNQHLQFHQDKEEERRERREEEEKQGKEERRGDTYARVEN